MTSFRALLVLAAIAASTATNCDTFDSCETCTTHKTWFPGSKCRWCPSAATCHAEGSVVNPCKSSANIVDVDKCPVAPSPSPPAPAPATSPLALNILEALLAKRNISVDIKQCVQDVARTDVLLSEFSADLKAKRYEPDAAEDLGRALTALSTAAAPCGLSSLRAELNVLAAAARDANFSAAVWVDADALASAISAGDSVAIAAALDDLLTAWRAVTQGCASGSKTCEMLDHLLELLGMTAGDVAPCEAAVEPALVQLHAAADAFALKNYTGTIALFASGLDILAVAVKADSCNLHSLGDEIAKLSPKLAAAVAKIESSGAVSIIVGSADVYDALYHAVLDVRSGNLADLGVQIGVLLTELRASKCTSKACDVLEGLLRALGLEVGDYTACIADLDTAWPELEAVVADAEAGHWQQAAKQTGAAMVSLAHATSSCGLDELGTILEETATKLNQTGLAHDIGDVVVVLTDGADLILDLEQLLADGKSHSWPSFGHDLGNLASWIRATHCTSFVCTLLEGLLDGAAIPFQSLQACAADLHSAEDDFVAGAAALAAHQYQPAVTYWAAGLHEVATSVADCHLADELEFVAQEAQVLGFGTIKVLDKVASILVHGSDFYNELYAALQAVEKHDYRTAGAELGKAMNELAEWTKGHACTSDFCYVVLGIFEYLGDVQGDIRNCEVDFQQAFHNFSAAVHVMSTSGTNGQLQNVRGSFPFATDPAALKAGIRDIGYGLEDISKGVGDCHLVELAAIIDKLAVKLGLVPEVKWIEEALHILIEGKEIEQEVGAACVAYADSNWVGFGYNVAKLVKTLVEGDAVAQLGEIPALVEA